MKKFIRPIILLELIIGYAPIFCLLLMGLIMAPFLFLSVLVGEFDRLPLLLAIIFGVLGCVGMIQVTIKLLKTNARIQSAKAIHTYLLAGVTGLLICFTYMRGYEWPEILIFVMPLLVLAHFIYLLRGYLFSD